MVTLQQFRIIALTEGVSFLLILFITMPLKYGLNINWPNQIIGMIHGVLFIAYVAACFYMYSKEKWSLKLLAVALFASIIPFGTIYTDQKYFKN